MSGQDQDQNYVVLSFVDADAAAHTVEHVRRDGGIFDDDGGGVWCVSCTVVGDVVHQLPLDPGEVYVSCGLGEDDVWPALVDPDDRWNGFVSPGFRPEVARALARRQTAYVARCEREHDDFQQDQLVVSPDERTIAHLVHDDYALSVVDEDEPWCVRWNTTREHSVWAIYRLKPGERAFVGAWHWCWYLTDATR
jgi:hypothetical protein